MIKKDSTDNDGFKIRVGLPDDSPDVPLEYGIELGLDLRDIYPDVSDSFLKALQNALFERGFVESSDFHKPNAFKQVRSAIISVTGYDAHRIIEHGKNLRT